MTWADGPLAAFDVETTGVDVESDRIVTATVAVILHQGQTVHTDSTSWLINPGVPIPQAATDVHGITDEQARLDGRAPAEALPEIIHALYEVWRAGIPVVVYNAPFDLTVLARELRRHAAEPVTHRRGHVIDPLVLDKGVDRFRRGSRKLQDVCAHYDVRLDGAHTSAGDALAAARVAWRIAQRHRDIGGMDLGELQTVQAGWYAEQQGSFGTYLTRLAGEQEDPEEAARLYARAAAVDVSWPVRPRPGAS